MNCEGAMRNRVQKGIPEGVLWVRLSGRIIRITRTACHFGGSRAWFVCPDCQRRCGVLYPVTCKRCRGLNHRSEVLSPSGRATLRAVKLRRQLDPHAGNLSLPIPSKPKLMRWHTYLAKRDAIRRADAAHISGIAVTLDRFRGLAGVSHSGEIRGDLMAQN